MPYPNGSADERPDVKSTGTLAVFSRGALRSCRRSALFCVFTMIQLEQFPDGCEGCSECCHHVRGGLPPFDPLPPWDGTLSVCNELTVEELDEEGTVIVQGGLCGIEVRDGKSAKPDRCNAQFPCGEGACVQCREEHGAHA